MLSVVNASTLEGIDAYEVKVEVDLGRGLPSFNIVGLPDASVKESRDRVEAAIKNSGYEFPVRKITVNLAPAGIKKEGAIFDLPIAVGILAPKVRMNKENLSGWVILGELSLNGELRRIKGSMSIAEQWGIKINAKLTDRKT